MKLKNCYLCVQKEQSDLSLLGWKGSKSWIYVVESSFGSSKKHFIPLEEVYLEDRSGEKVRITHCDEDSYIVSGTCEGWSYLADTRGSFHYAWPDLGYVVAYWWRGDRYLI